MVGPLIQVDALSTAEHAGGAAMVVAGNRLILSGCGGLAFFELSDVFHPRKVGDGIATGAIASYEAGSLVADDEMLAVAGGAGLVVISLSRPGLKLGPIDTGVLCAGCGSCLVLEGDRLYLSSRAVAVLDWALLKAALHGEPPFAGQDARLGPAHGWTLRGSTLRAGLSLTAARRARAGGEQGAGARGTEHGGLERALRRLRESQWPAPAPTLLLSEAVRDKEPAEFVSADRWRHCRI